MICKQNKILISQTDISQLTNEILPYYPSLENLIVQSFASPISKKTILQIAEKCTNLKSLQLGLYKANKRTFEQLKYT